MRFQLAVLAVLLLPGRILVQPYAGRLEERLVAAAGRERLELLVELTTAIWATRHRRGSTFCFNLPR